MKSKGRDATGTWEWPTVRDWNTIGNPGVLAQSLIAAVLSVSDSFLSSYRLFFLFLSLHGRQW